MLGRFRLKEAQRMQGRASQAQVAAGRTRDRLAQTHRAGLSEAAATASITKASEAISLDDTDFGTF
ncbi:MAG: hypothetical protein AB1374_13565, partial [Bacillota bacterium]